MRAQLAGEGIPSWKFSKLNQNLGSPNFELKTLCANMHHSQHDQRATRC